MAITIVKVRLQGDSEEEVEAAKRHLLAKHVGLCLSSPREGSNPRYRDNQKWMSYGDLVFEVQKGGAIKESIRRRRKGTKGQIVLGLLPGLARVVAAVGAAARFLS